MMMLEFVRENFRKFFIFSLWLALIVWTILGLIAGGVAGYVIVLNKGDNPVIGAIFGGVLGGILGFLHGLIFIVLFGGMIATFLKMDENLQKLADREEISRNNENSVYGHPFENGDNTEISYENWKKENPGKTVNEYYASRRK